MKKTYSRQRTQKGSTLVLAIFVVVLLSIFIGLAFDYTANTRLVGGRARDYSNAQALANGAVEIVFQQWQSYMKSHQIDTIPSNPTDPSYVSGSSYTSANSLKNLIATTLSTINSDVASTGYQVVTLTLVPVDQADIGRPSQSATYISKVPLSHNPGWITDSYIYSATATVSKIFGQAPAVTDPNFMVSVQRHFIQGSTSLFQGLFFFRDDLELNPGSNMNVNGPSYSASNIFAASCLGGTLTFFGPVTYSGDPPQPGVELVPRASQPLYSSYLPTPHGFYYSTDDGYTEGVNQPTYNSGSQWKNANGYTIPVYNDGLNDDSATSRAAMLSKVPSLDPLKLDQSGLNASNSIVPSNGNTTGGSHEIIERPVPTSLTNPDPISGLSDPSVFAAHRLYNSASLRVFINRNATGQKIHIYKPSSNNSNPEYNQEIPPGDGTSSSPLNIANYVINSITLTNTDPITKVVSGQLFDFREGHSFNVSTVDMSQLTPYLNTYLPIGMVLYITDITNPDAVTGNMGNSDAIRLINGGKLPDQGLTVVTDGALYIQGDYNTGGTYTTPQNLPASDNSSVIAATTVPPYLQKPAAVIGDAVTILSNNWKDATSSLGDSVNLASSTTMNAAIVSGIVTSTSSKDSGGAQNFPRFLENWSGKNFAYLGSMCELYASTNSTGVYGKPSVYIQPLRNWKFDTNFLITPPPGNLITWSYQRGRWSRDNSTKVFIP